MADNLHKTMAMDDKVTSLMSKIQDGIDKLLALANDFEKAGHKPTKSQVAMIESSASYLKQAAETFEMIK